jgi:hypothetical protein
VNAERSTVGSFLDLVQLALQGVDLALNLLEGGALLSDEQPPILAPGVAQEGNLDAGRSVRGARPDVEFKGSEDMQKGLLSVGG